jgi:quinol monooxygenase YgiN
MGVGGWGLVATIKLVFGIMAEAVRSVVIGMRFKEGLKDKGLEALRKCQELTRAEEGCVFYDVWVDKKDPELYYLLERWTNQDLLDIHLTKEHVAELRANLAECCESREPSHCRFIQ